MKDNIIFEQLGTIKAYNADCMEIMKDIPDTFFDLAIVDPPYGISVTKMNMGGRNTIKPNKNKIWDNEIPNSEYFIELFRVSKQQIIWGGNYFNLPISQYFVIWDKGETIYGRSFAECEFAWVSYKATKIYKCSPNQKDRIHPTQKPVDLYKWLLKNYSKDGNKILDTHGGSMSHAIACHDMGFELTIIEKDPEYYNEAIKRIKYHQRQLTLF